MGAEEVTVVVRRRIKPGTEAAFESAMQGFIGFALAFPGNRGINVLRPAPGGDAVYTVVDRFADSAAREAFKASAGYADWMSRLRAHSESDPVIEEIGGLGGWFTPPGTPAAVRPSRVKMALVTFVGVYPLTSMLPGFFGGLLPAWHPLLVNVFATASIVALLTWAVMPVLTRIFSAWLFGRSRA